MENYKLVTINSKYCDFLRKFDYRVTYNTKEKETRPFVGILFEIGEYKYFAPLSSPKPKHLKMKNNIDFYKIDSGKLGAVNFNNMIPVPDTEYNVINVNKKNYTYFDEVYQNLLRNQLRWLNRNGKGLRKKAKMLYNKRINNKLTNSLKNRCCNYKLLEEKINEYNKN